MAVQILILTFIVIWRFVETEKQLDRIEATLKELIDLEIGVDDI